MLENAILLNRLTKSSILRKVGVEVGDMPKEQATQTLRRIKDMFEQKTALNKDDSMSEYANPGPVENFIYYVKHNGQGEITVDSVGGDVDVKNLADLDNWVNKYYSGFGIPKAYFGYTNDGAGFNGGTSLSIISSVFANGVKHVQSAMTQALTDAISLFLVNRGLKSYLNRFTLKMKAPSTQEEINYREDLTNKISAISNFNGLFTDIENKPRRLKILKSLVSTLNFGDNILSEIDNEISATEKADKKAAEEAEAEAAKQAELEAAEKAQASTDSLALGNSSQATLESLQKNKQPDNLDNDSLNKQLDNLMLEDTTDLPTPEEAANNVDFSKNTD